MNTLTNDVIIYGAGNMGKAAVKIIKNMSGKVRYVLDRNSTIQGNSIYGTIVIGPEDLSENDKKNCDFLVAMTACSYAEIYNYLLQIGCNNIYLSGDYINEKLGNNNELINYWKMSKNEIDQNQISHILKDPISKLHYNYSTEWFTERIEPDILRPAICRDKYFPDFIKNILGSDESMIDTGILNGDYIKQFKMFTSENSKIYGFKLHPSENIDENLTQFANIFENELGEKNDNVSSLRIGLMEPFTEFSKYDYDIKSIDNMFMNTPYSFLRLYSMSPIYPMIIGAKETIKKYRPIIAANIGHYHDDFINVPILLYNTLEEYDFYFRIHSYQGCDCILYAVPKIKD